MREEIDGIEVIRTYTYATPSRTFWPRIVSFGAFCASSAMAGLSRLPEADVIYAVLPPLPLGVSGVVLSRTMHAPLVVNVQDIYPDVAVAIGVLKHKLAIAVFERMEHWIYSKSTRIVVISDGFRDNLRNKGVPESKVAVVPNWADTVAIRPGLRDNAFRAELGVGDEFLAVYSGGLTHNSNLEPVLEAAHELSNEPFRFVIVGDGVQKEALRQKASALCLQNLQFMPFQPLEKYNDVMAAADVTLVTLHSKATFASVPSKIYKQMAAARPIIAITNPGNELSRLVTSAQCGVIVSPGDSRRLAEVLRRALAERNTFSEMGRRGRIYVEQNCNCGDCVSHIEATLTEACGEGMFHR